MKKVIIALLLLQIVFFMKSDSGCQKYSWRWGEKPLEHTKCYCNCEKYLQLQSNSRQCQECKHYRVPKAIIIQSKHQNSKPAKTCNK